MPYTTFCGLDTVRAHFYYTVWQNGSSGPTAGPFNSNVATAAIQVGPWVQITGADIYSDSQFCNPGQVNNVEQVSAVMRATDHATFNIDANNPREDGVPSDLQFTIDFTGIRVFDNGVEINSGDVFSMMVSSTASTSYIALQVWPIPGAGSATLTAYRSVWSCQARQTGLSDGWFAGVDSALKITIVSAILHGVDYHSNNYDQATGVNKSFHMVEHDPAPAGSYGRWEWWDAQDDGSATNDSDNHDWPVCYTTSGGPDGIVEMKTEVQIVVSAVPADSTGIVVTGEGDIGDPSNGFTTIKMTQVSPPVYYPDPALKGYLVERLASGAVWRSDNDPRHEGEHLVVDIILQGRDALRRRFGEPDLPHVARPGPDESAAVRNAPLHRLRRCQRADSSSSESNVLGAIWTKGFAPAR